MSVTPGPGEHSASAPPASEEVHLPGPTILPLVAAIAITLIVIGTTLGWWLSIVGGVVLVIVAVRWLRDTRRDIGELPEQHSSAQPDAVRLTVPPALAASDSDQVLVPAPLVITVPGGIPGPVTKLPSLIQD